MCIYIYNYIYIVYIYTYITQTTASALDPKFGLEELKRGILSYLAAPRMVPPKSVPWLPDGFNHLSHFKSSCSMVITGGIIVCKAML